MSSLRTSDKKILEKLFRMEGGYVLNFSDRTMEQFFKDEFKISIYDKKYDSDSRTRSKANRLRSIWEKEDDKTIGMTILGLVDYAENESLTNDTRTIPFEIEKELLNKARDIGTGLLFSELSADYRPEVQQLKNKAQLIKDFNAFGFTTLKTNVKIYLLKVLFSHYEGTLRAYYGSGLFFLNAGIDNLNDYFKVMRRRMTELLSSDDTFSEIKNSNAYTRVIEPITSLYSSAEFLDVAWDDSILPSIVSMREEIADKDLFENGSEIHKMSVVVSNFFVEVSKEIETLDKFLEQKSKSFHEEDLPKQKQTFDDIFSSGKEKTIKHEHKHEHVFKNSAQEKDINLNHKYAKDSRNPFYIRKKDEDFYYKGRYITLSKNTDYYKVFCSLYAKLPDGGEVAYRDLISEIKSRIPKTENKTDDDMQKFIQRNLTDRSSGFLRYAGIPETEDSGKPLVEITRGSGVVFNNKTE